MISVLIPVYNFDIRQLVKDLYDQLARTGLAFEILCFDDGSKEDFKIINRQLSTLEPFNPSITPPFHYLELPQNLGRARIRNFLAKAAQYPYLLFMDCDSKVISLHYIQYYISHLKEDILLYGGRSYDPTPPDSPELYFHWHYGTKREQIPAYIRQQNPYHAFMTNNFLIPKIIFDQIQFDESLTQYGHEDTLFGFELQKKGIQILHLDNPLEHLGLEEVNTFLKKTEQGIENLVQLTKIEPALQTRLLKTYQQLNTYHLTGLINNILKTGKTIILHELKSRKPNLYFFDLYKLHLLIQTMRSA